jgi:hypothetical protein
MRVSCTYGSVRGAAGDRRPYRDDCAAVELEELGGQIDQCRHVSGWLAGFGAFDVPQAALVVSNVSGNFDENASAI